MAGYTFSFILALTSKEFATFSKVSISRSQIIKLSGFCIPSAVFGHKEF
jgi:hypothetical protein